MIKNSIALENSFARELWEIRQIRVLYLIFKAQDWRVRSHFNRDCARQRLGREPTIDDLVDQWENYGGLEHFLEVHRRTRDVVAMVITNEHYERYQIFFILAHKEFKTTSGVENENDLAFYFIEKVASQMRKRLIAFIGDFREER